MRNYTLLMSGIVAVEVGFGILYGGALILDYFMPCLASSVGLIVTLAMAAKIVAIFYSEWKKNDVTEYPQFRGPSLPRTDTPKGSLGQKLPSWFC